MTTKTGLLVIRAWQEDGSPVPLRADVRRTLDVTEGLPGLERFVDPDKVCAVVRAWLEAMISSPDATVTTS